MKANSISALHEIFTTTVWLMERNALRSSRDLILANIRNHTDFSSEEAVKSCYVQPVTYADEYTHDEISAEVNIINIDGPIIRNSGACAAGSILQKEEMIEAAKAGVIGHVLVINSPGGSALAINDYFDAIDFAHSLNQSVIAFVKGAACSAAYAVAMKCDKVYCYSKYDQVGCIGAMAAFTTLADGAIHDVTHEQYHEVYADNSPLKNHEAREASLGNLDPVKELVNKSADEFIAAVHVCRPNATDEQCLGLTYNASEVVDTLVDGFRDFDGCIDAAVGIAQDKIRQSRQAATTTVAG